MGRGGEEVEATFLGDALILNKTVPAFCFLFRIQFLKILQVMISSNNDEHI